MLDSSKSITLNSQQFMKGCLKVRDEAKRIDLAVLHRELVWIHEALEILTKSLTHKDSMRSSAAESCNSHLARLAPCE